MWMMREMGTEYSTIADAFGVKRSTVYTIVQAYDRILIRRSTQMPVLFGSAESSAVIASERRLAEFKPKYDPYVEIPAMDAP